MASRHTLLYSQNFARYYHFDFSAGLCWHQDQQIQRRYPPSTTMPSPVFDWQDRRVCNYQPHLRGIHYRCQAQILLPTRWWSLFFQFQACRTKETNGIQHNRVISFGGSLLTNKYPRRYGIPRSVYQLLLLRNSCVSERTLSLRDFASTTDERGRLVQLVEHLQ